MTDGIKLPVELHACDLELTPILRVPDELAMQHERLAFLNHHIAGELYVLAVLCYEPPGGEVGGREEDSLDLSPDPGVLGCRAWHVSCNLR